MHIKTFNNQITTYPLILLPSKILLNITEGVSLKAIKDHSTVTPPKLTKVYEPSYPLATKYVKVTKIEYFLFLWFGLLNSIIPLLISYNLSSSFPVKIAVFLGVFVLHTTVYSISGAYKNMTFIYEQDKKIKLSDAEMDELLLKYNKEMSDYKKIKKKNDLENDIKTKNYQEELRKEGIIIEREIYKRSLSPNVQAERSINTNIRGKSEIYFLEYVVQHLQNIVFIDMVPKGVRYIPDLTLICPETNLHMDIEIDEPYTLTDNLPIHYTDSKDNERNIYFNSINWCVIRFTEKQIVEQAFECVETIKSIHSSIVNRNSIFFSYVNNEPTWTYEESIIKAKSRYRESYLRNISST